MNTKDDVVVATLKKRYFELLTREHIPHTPAVTAEADRLETAIRELTAPKGNPS